VSTDRQGKSGLGLEAQRTAVMNYLDGGRWTLVGEFTDVESGKHACGASVYPGDAESPVNDLTTRNIAYIAAKREACVWSLWLRKQVVGPPFECQRRCLIPSTGVNDSSRTPLRRCGKMVAYECPSCGYLTSGHLRRSYCSHRGSNKQKTRRRGG
jgi:hypothetical protein